MKIGICANMNATKDDKIGLKWLKVYKTAKFEYVELPLAQIMQLTIEEFRDVLIKLKEVDMVCEACNNLYLPNIKLVGSKVQVQGILLKILPLKIRGIS